MLIKTDDVLGAEVELKAQESVDNLYTLSQYLNIPFSESKLTLPTTHIVHLVIQADSEKLLYQIPVAKLEEILQACVTFVKLCGFSKKQFQGILGSLMFIHKIVKPARYFVSRQLHTILNMKSGNAPYGRGRTKRH